MKIKKVKGITKVNGKWQIRAWYKEQYIYRKFKDGLPATHEVAKNYLNEEKKRIEAGQYYKGQKTLEEVYKFMDKEKRDKGRKKEQSTMITDTFFYKHIARVLNKDRQIHTFSEDEIVDFQNKILNSDLSANTQGKIISLLKQIYRTAKNHHWTQTDHTLQIDCPKIPKGKTKVFTKEQQKRLYEQAEKRFERNQNYLGIVILGLYEGLRLGEMRGLRWQDIDFESHELHVTRQYNSRLDRYTETKTEDSIRTLGIIPPHEAVLKRMHDRASKQAGFDESDCVLTAYHKGYTGKPLAINCLRETLGRLTVASGLSKERRFHVLRKTCGTNVFNKYGLGRACAWLGHSKEKMTWSVYTDKDVIRKTTSEKMRKDWLRQNRKKKGA